MEDNKTQPKNDQPNRDKLAAIKKLDQAKRAKIINQESVKK